MILLPDVVDLVQGPVFLICVAVTEQLLTTTTSAASIGAAQAPAARSLRSMENESA